MHVCEEVLIHLKLVNSLEAAAPKGLTQIIMNVLRLKDILFYTSKSPRESRYLLL